MADQPQRIPSFAEWLNEAFSCHENTSLGSLETMFESKFDLILTNPPFVVSGSKDIGKIIKANNKRKIYFGRKYSGVEGLFIQYIVQALKPNGDAWILLPETFFLRTTDKELRTWLFEQCKVNLLAMLPERTFFSTPKRVIITHLKKRSTQLTRANVSTTLSCEKTLLFVVSEIGETRDAKRFPCESNLPELVQTFKLHSAGGFPSNEVKRATVVVSNELYNKATLNLRHYWDKSIARELGMLGVEEDPLEAKLNLDRRIADLENIVRTWKQNELSRLTPRTPINWKTVALGDKQLFELSIGSRVLKEDIYKNRTGVPLYSANIRTPFGFVHAAKQGDLPYGGALWSIDSDFDCRGVAPGELYSITDHCGQVKLLRDTIDPHYLARQIKQAGLDRGFNRDYRPSLKVIRELEVELPVYENGDFDRDLMQEWTEFQEEIDRTAEEINKILNKEQGSSKEPPPNLT